LIGDGFSGEAPTGGGTDFPTFALGGRGDDVEVDSFDAVGVSRALLPGVLMASCRNGDGAGGGVDAPGEELAGPAVRVLALECCLVAICTRAAPPCVVSVSRACGKALLYPVDMM